MARSILLTLLSFVLACDRSAQKTPRADAGPAPLRRVEADPGSRDPGAPAIALALVAEGLPLVTDLEFVPGAPRTLIVTSQRGRACVFDLADASVVARPRGDLLELEVDSQSELGLLSVAFHPRYAENGRLFVHYNPKGKQQTRIAEFALPPGELGRTRAREVRVLIEVAQPYANHNGGELAFGPDGKLYVGLGDGGSGGDPHENGQNLGTLLGKILRLDVDGPSLPPGDNPFVARAGARPEIFAYGLRNPWKISFDPGGRLIVADVGQHAFEEVDILAAGDNAGWNTREGAHCFDPKVGCSRDGLIDPVFEYGRDLGISITGGYVYTGKAVPALTGRYVLADFVTRRLWALELPQERTGQAKSQVLGTFEPGPASLGRDAEGELYVSDYGSGNVFRVVAQ